ncbi:hypothetical protein BS50DRAFT_629714 [Corynespora cassiicola Philippines]|uniref:Uncharacterized protein n=1 Tax=Corynespora cassiicola Philippines TaxID=1448308 RepID=A0A2T2P8N3_CORCC|nr:hypothetical protein BS50DRAFT_629714 [Corynespora cassiicola Philippines]
MLKAVEADDFSVGMVYFGEIMPSIHRSLAKTKSVVNPRITIKIPREKDDSEYFVSTGTEDKDATKSVGTKYENVDYNLQYSQQPHSGTEKPLWSLSTPQPELFEIYENSSGILPVLEQRYSVASSKRNCQMDSLAYTLSFLLNVLRSVMIYSTSMANNKQDSLVDGVFKYPYMDIALYLEEIQGYRSDTSGVRSKHTDDYNTQSDRHIDVLSKFMYQNSPINLRQLEMMWSHNTPITTFAGVKILLRPGENVFSEEDRKLNALLLEKVDGGVQYPVNARETTTASEYLITLWSLTFNGFSIGRQKRSVLIPFFQNERNITSLPVFPVRFQDDLDDGATKKRLINRGKQYFKYCQEASFLEYTGKASDLADKFADFVQGKGEGQIILLHGPPGTSKTLTAECVAEFTKRPLLQFTAADLGDKPEDLEKNLLRFFKDANDWDAVALLDEADIRVGRFDEAFTSRIHVAIGYDRLDDKARLKIWENLFEKFKDDAKHGGKKILVDQDAKQFVEKNVDLRDLQWNGREIRNAFQTAVALAMYDHRKTFDVNKDDSDDSEPSYPTVEEKHLKQVVNLSTAFKKYMRSTRHDMKYSDYAWKHGLRDDEHDEPKKDRKKSVKDRNQTP